VRHLRSYGPATRKKIFVVGDDKPVSPMAAFIEDAKVERLARGFLKDQSFKTLLLPGASLYDLCKGNPRQLQTIT
jgi:hypothetical protein